MPTNRSGKFGVVLAQHRLNASWEEGGDTRAVCAEKPTENAWIADALANEKLTQAHACSEGKKDLLGR